jgi:hexosaminidase
MLPLIGITDYHDSTIAVLLDVSRHFFSVAFIKNFLDVMAQYKINRFQWHLTDDQDGESN